MSEIINSYDQLRAAGGDRIAISYRDRGNPREMKVPGWYVWRMKDGQKLITDKHAHWSDYGAKSFTCGNRAAKKVKLEEAIQWANENFGWREFVRNRMGDYVEKEVNLKFPIRKQPAAVSA